MQRKSPIDILHSVSELLVQLQLNGCLDSVVVPDWVKGTSVEELLDAVRYLGEGEWLEGYYPGRGLQESADHWLHQFMIGHVVPTREQANAFKSANRSCDGGQSDEVVVADGDGEAFRIDSLKEYLAHASKSAAARLIKRIDNEAGFRAVVLKNIEALAEALACAVMQTDDEFLKAKGDFIFLKSHAVVDKDLVGVSKFFLDAKSGVLDYLCDAFGVADSERTTARKRVGETAAELAKLVKAHKR